MKTQLKILCSIFSVLLLASCQNPSSTYSSKDQVFVPKNLPQYFDSLLLTGNYYIPWHGDSITEVSAVIRSITLLQDYVDGKIDKYPAWAVKQSLDAMALEIAYGEAHGYCDEDGRVLELPELIQECFTDNFFEIYMEQAVHFCPDVRLLTDRTSADGQIGILTYTDWSGHPMLSYLLYKTKKGYFSKFFWTISDAYYDRIYQVEHEGELYYLLVNFNYSYTGDIFSLVSLSGNRPKECLQPVPEDIFRLVLEVLSSDDKQIIFNPETLTWKECKKNKNGYWAEFYGSKTFRLVFGDKIYIEME